MYKPMASTGVQLGAGVLTVHLYTTVVYLQLGCGMRCTVYTWQQEGVL